MGLGNHGHSHSHKKKNGHISNESDTNDEDDHSSHNHKRGGHKHSGGGGGHGHSHSHGHSHDGHGGNKFCGCCHFSDKMRISSMLSMTLFFFLVEIIAGQITKSISLTTDAFHMLSDALALCIGLFSIIISKRKSKNNTFGWVRAEVLGPLINSVFLVSLCLTIVIEAVERLFEEKEIKDPNLLLYVGCIGLGINVVGLFVFGHAHSHSVPSLPIDEDSSDTSSASESEVNTTPSVRTDEALAADVIEEKKLNQERENTMLVLEKSQQEKLSASKKKTVIAQKNKKKTPKCHILSKEANMNMRAVFLHVLTDALGSVIVVISALLNIYQTNLHIPKAVIVYIDPVLCLALVVLILSSTLPLLKESALILLQTVPKEIKIKQLKRDIVKKVPGIIAVHELHVWKLSGSKIIATAHVTCHNSVEYMQIATDLKSFFHKKGIHSTTIQPEFTDPIEGVPMDNCILECLQICNQNTCCGQTNQNINLNEENRNLLVNFNQQAQISSNVRQTSSESNAPEVNITIE